MLPHMHTLARNLIHDRYVEKGETTRIVVLPLPQSGLPSQLVEAKQPVPLDLLADRPVNLQLTDEGMAADLCFAGPPQRCYFPWETVIAVQDSTGELIQTVVVAMALVMEDNSLTLLSSDHFAGVAPMDGPQPTPAPPDSGSGPVISLVPNRPSQDSPVPPSPRGWKRPQLHVINGDGPK